MKTTVFVFSLVAVSGLQFSGRAAELTDPSADSLNRFGLSYRMGFNVSAQFKNIGNFAPQGHLVLGPGFQPGSPGPGTGSLVNRTYEDGYNWVDVSGNQGGNTWYWGYDHASQVQGNNLVMHSTSAPGSTSGNQDDDVLPGFELSYARELIRKSHWRGGLQFAFGYSDLNIDDHQTVAISAARITDSFALPPAPGGGFVVPPPAPYTGPYALSENGNPLLGASPSRTLSAVSGSVAGERRFGADLFTARLGPYLELPLGARGVVGLSAGFALAFVSSDFSFHEAANVPGTPVIGNAGQGSHSDLLPGGFVAGTCQVSLSEKLDAFAGAQFMDVGRYTHALAGRAAVLDLREAIFVTIGLSYSF